MDPTKNLSEQVELAKKMLKDYEDLDSNGIDQDDANRLAQLVEALDEWIRRGGFLPVPWQNAERKDA